MKSLLPVRPALLAGLLSFGVVSAACAQSPSPSATTSPISKPSMDSATPTPASSASTSAPTERSGATVRKEILDKYDKNHDGVLDADERAAFEKDRAARKAERLQKYDKNHDGKLDENERAAMRADREAAKKAEPNKTKISPTP